MIGNTELLGSDYWEYFNWAIDASSLHHRLDRSTQKVMGEQQLNEISLNVQEIFSYITRFLGSSYGVLPPVENQREVNEIIQKAKESDNLTKRIEHTNHALYLYLDSLLPGTGKMKTEQSRVIRLAYQVAGFPLMEDLFDIGYLDEWEDCDVQFLSTIPDGDEIENAVICRLINLPLDNRYSLEEIYNTALRIAASKYYLNNPTDELIERIIAEFIHEDKYVEEGLKFNAAKKLRHLKHLDRDLLIRGMGLYAGMSAFGIPFDENKFTELMFD